MRRSLPSRMIGRLRERPGARAPRLTTQSQAPGEVEKRAPIFIVGCQRSGTSLLRRILDSHPNIACPPESKFILPMTEVLRDRRSLSGLDSMGFDGREVRLALANFVGGFFDQYAAVQGKSRWADKTPNYVDCLDEIWELFESSARFIVLVRHGMDVAFSLSDPHRKYPAIKDHVERHAGNIAVAGAHFWREQNEKIETFRNAHSSACFRIRYENVTSTPEVTLPQLFEFLEEPWIREVIDYSSFSHHAGYEDPDVRRRRRIEPNSGRYLTWPDAKQREVREACEPVLTKLGYE